MPDAPASGLHLPPGGLAWDETLELRTSDGIRLRGALWRGEAGPGGRRGPRGLAVYLNGRTEFLEKSTVPAAGLVRRGFSVASLDWRGQGRSQRLVGHPLKGHVESFGEFHRDLAALLAHPAVAELGPPRLMLAHSMGGAIGLGALLRGHLRAAAVVLTAPMLGIRMSWYQRLIAPPVLAAARRAGALERWPPPPRQDQPYVFLGFEDNMLTGDRAAFDWMVEALRREPAFRMAFPTIGWIGAARDEMRWLNAQRRLGLPALFLLGGREGIVEPRAVREGAARLGARLVEIAEARHEHLMEAAPVRAEVWEAIDRFLAESGI